jgi:hypothetical protein
MTIDPNQYKSPLHPNHHWGPFANDPWPPDLDPVKGEIWELACRGGRVGTMRPDPLSREGGGEPSVQPALSRE